MTPQQLVKYNKIIEDFNKDYSGLALNLRLGQAFYNKYNLEIYNNQPNPTLFYEEDNHKAMATILKDIENYVSEYKYE